MVSLIFFLFSLFSGISQEYNNLTISDQLFELLESEHFSPQKQLLVSAPEMIFPYNISVSFQATANRESQSDHELVFAIPQEIAFITKNHILQLLGLLKQIPLPVKTTVLFQADEFSRLPPDFREEIPAGTNAFIEATENPSSVAVILLSPAGIVANENLKVTVIPGADGIMTPLWLLRQIPLNIDQTSVLPYRLNLTENDERLEAFLKAGFDAVAVRFSASNEKQSDLVYAALTLLAEHFSTAGSTFDMRNYILVPFTSNLWIGERSAVLVYIISIAFVLFFVSSFSLFGKNKAQTQKDFKQIWYLIPITILVSAASLSLGQFFAEKLLLRLELTPIAVMILKTGFSFLFVSFLFIAQVHFRLPISPFVYGFLLTLVSIINIFIFTSVDISFLFIFILEYIIIYVTRLARRLIPLIISSVLMLAPFIPYIIFLIVNASPQKIAYLAEPNFIGNILLACALVPFQIMWLRILVRMNLFGKTRNISGIKIAIATITAIAVVVAVGTSVLFTVSYISHRMNPISMDNQAELSAFTPFTVTEEQEGQTVPVSCKVTTDTFMDLMSVRLEIISKLSLIRYDVSVSAQTEIPVFDSEIPFKTISAHIPGKVSFLLPEYPALKTAFSYVTNAALTQNISVVFFIQTGTDTAVRINRTIELSATKAIAQ